MKRNIKKESLIFYTKKKCLKWGIKPEPALIFQDISKTKGPLGACKWTGSRFEIYLAEQLLNHPLEVSQGIICHELAHIKEKDHFIKNQFPTSIALLFFSFIFSLLSFFIFKEVSFIFGFSIGLATTLLVSTWTSRRKEIQADLTSAKIDLFATLCMLNFIVELEDKIKKRDRLIYKLIKTFFNTHPTGKQRRKAVEKKFKINNSTQHQAHDG